MSSELKVPQVTETEVVAKAKRRRFTAEYKQRILDEVDRAGAVGLRGEVGAILRREGVYSSHLAAWRKLRDEGELLALTPKKRGPKAKVPDERDRLLAEKDRQLRRVEARLKRAEAMLELQKKLSELLGIVLPPPPPEEP
jgi:transposase